MSGTDQTYVLTEEQILALRDLALRALGHAHVRGVVLPDPRDLVTVLVEPLTLAAEIIEARRESV